MNADLKPLNTTRRHASVIAFGACGVLIEGPSGSGKSGLALDLVSIGARLVADDTTLLRVVDGEVVATCPPGFSAQIEARGVGILSVPSTQSAIVRLIVDLGQVETERLPPDRRTSLLGCDLPVLHKVESRHFVAAIKFYVSGGRIG